MVEAHQFVRPRRQHQDHATPTNALFLQDGQNGSVGALAAKLADLGFRAEQGNVILLSMGEILAYAQRLKPKKNNAL